VYIVVTVDAVPVYDARKDDSGFYELVLNVDRLDRINCELPAGSCAIVAYTLNTWEGRIPPINVSFNIKWAMLLGVPAG
jgi:hypothetical protein